MATKTKQLQKLMKIRAILVKFKLSVKSVNPVLENLLKRDKPPLDAKLLREIESILQVREYLKKSRLQTTEIDREINELLENLHKAFLSDTSALPPDLHTEEHPSKPTGLESNPNKRPAATPSSDTPALPPELHTKQHPKATIPDPNPRKRAATTPSSSEPQSKKPRSATGPRTAKNPMGPGRPSTQPAKATLPPWPLKTVRLGENLLLIADKTCCPVIDIDPQDQSYRVYDHKKGFLSGGAAFKIKASTNTTFLFSRPDKQILMTSAIVEVDLQFLWVKDFDQVVSALKRNGSNCKMEHPPRSSLPHPTPDDSEADSFNKVKQEDVQSKKEGGERPRRRAPRRIHAYMESDSEDSSDDDYVPGRDFD